jgi:hypothetical protein
VLLRVKQGEGEERLTGNGETADEQNDQGVAHVHDEGVKVQSKVSTRDEAEESVRERERERALDVFDKDRGWQLIAVAVQTVLSICSYS